MPDDNKPATDTSMPMGQDVSSTPPQSGAPMTDQAMSAPPPPMQDGSVSPPPPIVEETKPEESTSSKKKGSSDEESSIPDIPPVVTTSESGGKKFGGKKVIATILGILVLVGGVGAGVVLVQRQQDIREKAAYMTGACRECENGKCVQRLTPPNCNPAENKCEYNSDCTCRGDGSCAGITKNCCSAKSYPDPSCTYGLRCGTQPTKTTPNPNAACINAGGTCFQASNCYAVGREYVNEGNGCEAGICCTVNETNPQSDTECINAGGTCFQASNCYAVDREYVNEGKGCDAGICCTITEKAPSSESCTDSSGCAFRELCNRTTGKCESLDPRFCDSNSCAISRVTNPNYILTDCYVNHAHTDDADDPTVNDVLLRRAVQSSTLGLKDCGAEQIDVVCDGKTYVDGVWIRYDEDCTPKTTPPPGLDCQCLDIKVFDEEWSQLSIEQLASLEAGDVVRFTVSGVSSAGAIDKARFTINGVQRPEVTAKRPGTNEFYDEYTIPEGVSNFTINAELHHTTIGWF
ncbi:MAG: hypothetical protein P8Y17_01605 [Patescibacteria group bacterium]